jgi:signal transduction histidine kinase
MAWITSATGGSGLANRRNWTPKGLLLLAHIALLILLLQDRSTADATPGLRQAAVDVMPAGLGSISAPALMALGTGLMLAFFLLAGSRSPWATKDAAVFGQPAGALSLPAIARQTEETLSDAHAGLMARLNHDLRTPLNALLGFADLMHAETFGPLGHERYRTYVSHMQSCGHDMLRATESTLAMAELLSSPGLAGTQAINLSALIEGAWTKVAGTGLRAAPALTMLVARELRVCGDVSALRQSLVNLLEAALMRTGDGGRIECGARCSDGRVQAWISVTGRRGQLATATTGCRPPTSACSAVDDLPISVSRKLLGLQGVPLVIATDEADKWIVTLSLEDATQSDFFTDQPATRGTSIATTSPR